MAIVIILLLLIILTYILCVVYSKNRAATNFRIIYIRALRKENNKQFAIAEGLKHLRSFLVPFDQLSDDQIKSFSSVFAGLLDPPGAIQPILQRAFKTKTIDLLADTQQLGSWKELWKSRAEK